MPKIIPADQIRWNPGTQDLLGRVFEFEGEFYRAIHPDRVDFARSLLERPSVQSAMESGLLVKTKPAEFELDGHSLVLHHQRIPFITLGYEWPRSLLRDAALCSVDLNLTLLKDGLAMFDAHCYNLNQMGCCRPIWSDFGSIVEADPANPKMGLRQFHAFFSNPLRLINKDAALDRIARGLIEMGGISDKEFAALNTPEFKEVAKAAKPKTGSLLSLLGLGKDEQPQKKKNPKVKTRAQYLQSERDKLVSLTFPDLSTRWGEYHSEDMLLADATKEAAARNPRQRIIHELICKLRPKRVVDLACNGGYYSFMAARAGAEVFSVDYDAKAMERLYHVAKQCTEPLSIAASYYNITMERKTPIRGDLTLALAITHHLWLSQSMSFAQIAALLAGYTTDSLITEFMECGLGNTVPLPDPLPAEYTRENFLAALRTQFQSVEVIPYEFENPPSVRTLVLCRGKRG